MKQYGLYTKGKSDVLDILNKIQAGSLEDAIEIFAEIKKISKKNLIEIWDVKEITK